eukprot:scaffold624_cov402-Prasinococcus_capsulatus_cf.AAC.7
MAGAGVTPGNAAAIIRATRVTCLHGSARKVLPRAAPWASPTKRKLMDEFGPRTKVTCSKLVSEIIQNANSASLG